MRLVDVDLCLCVPRVRVYVHIEAVHIEAIHIGAIDIGGFCMRDVRVEAVRIEAVYTEAVQTRKGTGIYICRSAFKHTPKLSRRYEVFEM